MYKFKHVKRINKTNKIMKITKGFNYDEFIEAQNNAIFKDAYNRKEFTIVHIGLSGIGNNKLFITYKDSKGFCYGDEYASSELLIEEDVHAIVYNDKTITISEDKEYIEFDGNLYKKQ